MPKYTATAYINAREEATTHFDAPDTETAIKLIQHGNVNFEFESLDPYTDELNERDMLIDLSIGIEEVANALSPPNQKPYSWDAAEFTKLVARMRYYTPSDTEQWEDAMNAVNDMIRKARTICGTPLEDAEE